MLETSTEPAGPTVRLTATDSYSLADETVRLPIDHAAIPAGSVIIDADQLGDVAKMLRKLERSGPRSPVAVTVTDDAVTFATVGQSMTARTVPGEYPAVDQLWKTLAEDLPATHPGPVGCNPTFLARFTKVRMPSGQTSGKACAPLVITQRDALKPMAIRVGTDAGGSTFRGLLMPVRLNK